MQGSHVDVDTTVENWNRQLITKQSAVNVKLSP